MMSKKIYIVLIGFLKYCTQLLLTEQEVCMGESCLRSWVQNKHSEGCAHNQGQDFSI